MSLVQYKLILVIIVLTNDLAILLPRSGNKKLAYKDILLYTDRLHWEYDDGKFRDEYVGYMLLRM